jgi:hypothetical protein
MVITKETFSHGTINQWLAYLHLLQDVAHCDLDTMLQPALQRTFGVVGGSLAWLAEGMSQGLFSVKPYLANKLEADLLHMMKSFQNISDRALCDSTSESE